MTRKSIISPLLEELNPLCPSGYALALHIKFTTPTFLFQTYDKKWTEHYTQNGMVLFDPVVRWGFENTGSTSWGSLKKSDENGVLDKASEFGLKYGTVISLIDGESRSIGGFARPDRDHTADEKATLKTILQKIHRHTADSPDLSEVDRAALKSLSVSLTHS